jgi:hypothetical protein
VSREIESMLTPPDPALQVGADESHESFLSCTKEGLAQGSQGRWGDICMLRPWGFDLADTRADCSAMMGTRRW